MEPLMPPTPIQHSKCPSCRGAGTETVTRLLTGTLMQCRCRTCDGVGTVRRPGSRWLE